jgi:predicted tellurium resistance membrane protein TerC
MEDFVALGMLVLLQAVLGFDNLLYISLESKRAPVHLQTQVRRFGIGLAIALRIGLLFALMRVITYFQDPVFSIHRTGFVEGSFNLHAMIVLLGGVFIMYTATKEILHMMSLEIGGH